MTVAAPRMYRTPRRMSTADDGAGPHETWSMRLAEPYGRPRRSG